MRGNFLGAVGRIFLRGVFLGRGWFVYIVDSLICHKMACSLILLQRQGLAAGCDVTAVSILT